MHLELDPIRLMIETINELYPSLDLAIVFEDDLYGNENVLAKLDEDLDKGQDKIVLDYEIPLVNIPAEIAEKTGHYIVDILEEDSDEMAHAIAEYAFERFKQKLIQLHNIHKEPVIH